jgi:MFS family permease
MQHREMPGRNFDYRWVVLAAATFAQAAASFVMQGLGILAGFLQEDFRLSTFEVGLLIASATAAPIFVLPFVGDLLDRHSERLIMATGAVVLAIGLVLCALAPGFIVLLATLFIVGCGYATTQPGGSKSVSNWFRGNQLGFAMGVRQSGLPLGGAAAAALLPIITTLHGWRIALLTGTALSLAGGLAFAALYRSPATASADIVTRSRPAMGFATIVTMLRHPWMRSIVLSGASLVCAQFAILTYFMLYLRDAHAIPLVNGAWLMFVAQLSGVAGRVILAALSDRPGASRFRLVIASMLAVTAGLIALALLQPQMSWSLLILISAWFGFFGLGWYGPWIAFLADVAPPERLGLTLGVAMALNQVAAVVTPPLLGFLHDLTAGYAAVWGSSAILLVAATWATRSVK